MAVRGRRLAAASPGWLHAAAMCEYDLQHGILQVVKRGQRHLRAGRHRRASSGGAAAAAAGHEPPQVSTRYRVNPVAVAML